MCIAVNGREKDHFITTELRTVAHLVGAIRPVFGAIWRKLRDLFKAQPVTRVRFCAKKEESGLLRMRVHYAKICVIVVRAVREK